MSAALIAADAIEAGQVLLKPDRFQVAKRLRAEDRRLRAYERFILSLNLMESFRQFERIRDMQTRIKNRRAGR